MGTNEMTKRTTVSSTGERTTEKLFGDVVSNLWTHNRSAACGANWGRGCDVALADVIPAIDRVRNFYGPVSK